MDSKIPSSILISYALKEALSVVKAEYKKNFLQIKDFEKNLNSTDRLISSEFEEQREKIASIYAEQENLTPLVFHLAKTQEAFEQLPVNEKRVIDFRMKNPSQDLELAVKNRSTGELLSVAS